MFSLFLANHLQSNLDTDLVWYNQTTREFSRELSRAKIDCDRAWMVTTVLNIEIYDFY